VNLRQDHQGKLVRQPPGTQEVLHVVRLFGQIHDCLAGFLPVDPFDMAGLPPIREVLLSDGPAAEVIGQNPPNIGLFAEPVNDFNAGAAVFEAMAE
jgi:hypothetical protein